MGDGDWDICDDVVEEVEVVVCDDCDEEGFADNGKSKETGKFVFEYILSFYNLYF